MGNVYMLEKYIDLDGIVLKACCCNWQEAIDQGAEPLLKRGVILPAYVDSIKKNHQELGPYMVIAPGIMLAHARPECGAKGLGLTVLTLENPIVFGSEMNDPVTLVITLATPDDMSHLHMLEALMDFLMCPELVAKLIAADTPAEALDILKNKRSDL